MVVRIKPESGGVNAKCFCTQVIGLPFLHLTGRDVNTVSLTPSAHGKIDIKGRQTLANITLGNNVEGSRMIEHVVIEGKFTAKIDWFRCGTGRDEERNNLGI